MFNRRGLAWGSEAAWDIGLMFLTAAFAGGIQLLPLYSEESKVGNFLFAQDPNVLFLTYGLLLGVPFVFAAWRAGRHAKARSWHYRVTLVALIGLLGILSFGFVAWFIWFAVNVICRGGEF
jgi:cyanate permease